MPQRRGDFAARRRGLPPEENSHAIHQAECGGLGQGGQGPALQRSIERRLRRRTWPSRWRPSARGFPASFLPGETHPDLHPSESITGWSHPHGLIHMASSTWSHPHGLIHAREVAGPIGRDVEQGSPNSSLVNHAACRNGWIVFEQFLQAFDISGVDRDGERLGLWFRGSHFHDRVRMCRPPIPL
jgi:hypothetical protein